MVLYRNREEDNSDGETQPAKKNKITKKKKKTPTKKKRTPKKQKTPKKKKALAESSAPPLRVIKKLSDYLKS